MSTERDEDRTAYFARKTVGETTSEVDLDLRVLNEACRQSPAALEALSRIRAALYAAEKDATRLDWIQAQAKSSPTGISFDHARHVEDGYVLESGFRFMRRRFLGERATTLRDAIDAARRSTATTSSGDGKGE